MHRCHHTPSLRRDRLTANDELELSYEATTTKETACSLTNHTYFNLAGHTTATEGGEGVRKHMLSMDCPTWLVTGTDGVVGPNGNKLATYDETFGVSSNGIYYICVYMYTRTP